MQAQKIVVAAGDVAGNLERGQLWPDFQDRGGQERFRRRTDRQVHEILVLLPGAARARALRCVRGVGGKRQKLPGLGVHDGDGGGEAAAVLVAQARRNKRFQLALHCRLQIGVERGRHVAGQHGAVARPHRRAQVGLLAVLLHQMIHLGLETQREPVQQRDPDAACERLIAGDEHVGACDAPAEIELAETPGLEAKLRARRQTAVAAAWHKLAVDEQIDLGIARAANPQIVPQQEDARDFARSAAIGEVESPDLG